MTARGRSSCRDGGNHHPTLSPSRSLDAPRPVTRTSHSRGHGFVRAEPPAALSLSSVLAIANTLRLRAARA
jgi:hypothetical protein